jgi:hypothetical protein
MKKIKELRQTVEPLSQLLEGVLEISTDDYRIVLSDRNGGMVDVYLRDDRLNKLYERRDLTVAIQTIELLVPDSWQIAFHYCTSKHGQFNAGAAA